MKFSYYTPTVLALAVLTGCAAAPSKPVTEAEVRSGIQVETGYASCRTCAKVKTFSSPPVVTIASHLNDGWINAKISLIATNHTDNFVPRYQLMAKFVNNGIYTHETDVYISEEDRSSKPRAVGERRELKCVSNIGNGCSWIQIYELDTNLVETSLKNKTDIQLLVGKPVESVTRTNDGFTQKAAIVNRSIVGAGATIPSQAITGFVKGIQAMGAEMPTSAGR